MGAIPAHNTAIVDTPWDGGAAEKNLNTGENQRSYLRVYAWYDSSGADGDGDGYPDAKADWKFPHHEVSADGVPGAANVNGLRNALSRLPQAQIPSGDDAGVKAHIQHHLDAYNARTDSDDQPELDLELTLPIATDAVQVRNIAKRELDIRIVPWGVSINTLQGLEEFKRGAFSDAKPEDVLLMGLEHEIHMGMGQDGRPVATRHPVGKAINLDDRPDGQYGTFRVANTSRGDEVLALAADGIVRGASAEYGPVPGGTEYVNVGGRRKAIHTRAILRGVSTTYRPAFEHAGVVAVRSAEQEDAPVADQPAAVEAVPQDQDTAARMSAVDTKLDEFFGRFGDRIEKLEERARAAFQLPTEQGPKTPDVSLGDWTKVIFGMLTGDRIPDTAYRTVQDLIISDNLGVVPEAFVHELRGVIAPMRPFMETTRRLPLPASGTTMRVPKIVQRPQVSVQSGEKQELASQKTIITSDTFEMVTKGGVGDLSLQLLKRSDPSFLDLYVQLLAEAYSIECDDEAVTALADALGGFGGASPLDPNDLSLGPAFTQSYDAIKRGPDTIWLSTQAVADFIDAKATTTNQPLYSSINLDATVAGGVSGTISGLRAVHVPALDAHGAFAIVGPSIGFAWAEDGTYTLQVDVPAKAGRDVALVGMLWFVPWYPDAFSLYNVAS